MKDENQDATNHRDSWIALGILLVAWLCVVGLLSLLDGWFPSGLLGVIVGLLWLTCLVGVFMGGVALFSGFVVVLLGAAWRWLGVRVFACVVACLLLMLALYQLTESDSTLRVWWAEHRAEWAEHRAEQADKRFREYKNGTKVPRGWRKGEWELYKAEHPDKVDDYLRKNTR